MKRKYFIILSMLSLFFSCEKAELESMNQEDAPNVENIESASSVQTLVLRTGGDGKYDVTGYGYNSFYSLFDDGNGVENQIIDLNRFKSGQGVNPSTGASVSFTPGTVEESQLHGTTHSSSKFYQTFTSYFQSVEENIKMKTPTLFGLGKIKFSTKYGIQIDRKEDYSIYDIAVEKKTKRIYLNTSNADRLKYFTTTVFRESLKSNSGDAILRDYGTHVMTDILVGSKLNIFFSAKVSSNAQNQFSDMSAKFLSYLQTAVKDSIAVSRDVKDLQLVIDQLGGGVSHGTKSYLFDGKLNPSVFDYAAWVNSVTTANSVFMGIGSSVEKNIGIWKLTDNVYEQNKIKAAIIKKAGKTNVYKFKSNSGVFLKYHQNDIAVTDNNHYMASRNGAYTVNLGSYRISAGWNIDVSAIYGAFPGEEDNFIELLESPGTFPLDATISSKGALLKIKIYVARYMKEAKYAYLTPKGLVMDKSGLVIDDSFYWNPSINSDSFPLL